MASLIEIALTLNLNVYSKPSVQTIGTVFIFKRKKREQKYVEIINDGTIIAKKCNFVSMSVRITIVVKNHSKRNSLWGKSGMQNKSISVHTVYRNFLCGD